MLLVEKGDYPGHKVCGEYISNEVLPFLKAIDAYPEECLPSQINRFQLSGRQGKSVEMKLKMGGFGLSRYRLDDHLYKKAKECGAEFLLNTQVEDVQFGEDHFLVAMVKGGVETARIVIGAYGKRSRIDKKLNRKFISRRSPYIGVKYHVKADFPRDLVALHNFDGGYCGIGAIEDGLTNVCYLGNRNSLREHGKIEDMERQVLFKNPFLKEIFTNSDFIFDRPEVINEISFEPKSAVSHHILMSGDTAGLVSPLCGNGMAMAIHSAKILSELICQYYTPKKFDRAGLENMYEKAWKHQFAWRLWFGRHTQKLFGSSQASSFLVNLAKTSPLAANFIVRQTHGGIIK